MPEINMQDVYLLGVVLAIILGGFVFIFRHAQTELAELTDLERVLWLGVKEGAITEQEAAEYWKLALRCHWEGVPRPPMKRTAEDDL